MAGPRTGEALDSLEGGCLIYKVQDVESQNHGIWIALISAHLIKMAQSFPKVVAFLGCLSPSTSLYSVHTGWAFS